MKYSILAALIGLASICSNLAQADPNPCLSPSPSASASPSPFCSGCGSSDTACIANNICNAINNNTETFSGTQTSSSSESFTQLQSQCKSLQLNQKTINEDWAMAALDTAAAATCTTVAGVCMAMWLMGPGDWAAWFGTGNIACAVAAAADIIIDLSLSADQQQSFLKAIIPNAGN